MTEIAYMMSEELAELISLVNWANDYHGTFDLRIKLTDSGGFACGAIAKSNFDESYVWYPTVEGDK